jgi:hypothetical protein
MFMFNKNMIMGIHLCEHSDVPSDGLDHWKLCYISMNALQYGSADVQHKDQTFFHKKYSSNDFPHHVQADIFQVHSVS